MLDVTFKAGFLQAMRRMLRPVVRQLIVYGVPYSSFSRLLEDAEKSGLIRLRRDSRSGTYVIDDPLNQIWGDYFDALEFAKMGLDFANKERLQEFKFIDLGLVYDKAAKTFFVTVPVEGFTFFEEEGELQADFDYNGRDRLAERSAYLGITQTVQRADRSGRRRVAPVRSRFATVETDRF